MKWHFFAKDREIIKEFTKYYFFVKSIHLSGDFKDIKIIEIQSFLPHFLFKFYKINGFYFKKTDYGISYVKDLSGNLFSKPFDFIFLEGTGGYGWIKTDPEIKFKIYKNKYFLFESKVEAVPFPPKNEVFKLKNYDLEIYKASSPHFSLIFPDIEEIEVCYKDEKGSFRIKEKGKEKKIKFGSVDLNQESGKDEKLSFYLKAKEMKNLKKFIKNPFLKNLKEIEIKCASENGFEKCRGFFAFEKYQSHKE